MAESDPRVAAARREVVAARGELLDEVHRLGASARAAADLPAQIRANPERAAAVAGGLGFLVLGGPGRIVRGLKRLVRGPGSPYPSGMLPGEIDAVLRGLGDDGDRVRGVLEREFAAYVTEKERARRRSVRGTILSSFVMPAATAALRSAAKRAMAGEPVFPTGAVSDASGTGAGGDGAASDSGRKASRGRSRGSAR